MAVISTHLAPCMIFWGGGGLKHTLIQCGSSVMLALHTYNLDHTLENICLNKTCDVSFFSTVLCLFFLSPDFYLQVSRS